MRFYILYLKVVQCRKRKGCYPSKWRYVKFILPGVLLAGTGLIIFAFLETDENYKYTHSAWHVVIALSIVFLLPSRKNLQGMDIQSEDAITSGTGNVQVLEDGSHSLVNTSNDS